MCDCINPFAWLLEAIREGTTLEELKERGLVGEGVTLEELLPRCMCASVPAQRDTDNVSERAQVVAAAVAEDDDKTLEELNAEYHKHWSDWDDFGDYGYGPNSFEDWLKVNYPKAHRRYLVIWQRRISALRRQIAIKRGARPYTVVFELADGIRFFDGEVYRVISPADFSSNDIPF